MNKKTNKALKMKAATKQTRKKNTKNVCKKILTWPIRAIKWLWNLLSRVCRAIWNWLKSIDIVGMINLTLLVAIIVLFSSLIADFVRCGRCPKNSVDNNKVVVAQKNTVKNQTAQNNGRKVVQRKVNTTLPLRPDMETGITPKIKVVGVKKPVVVTVASLPAKELPKQNLYGDVIVDVYPDSPVLSNGVNVDGNLFIQNMRKYTLPCDAKINGHLFVRNVHKLNFCGSFTVRGNIYVNRESSFGPIPSSARIGGRVML